MKEKFKKAHMRVAFEYAKLSYCKRRQVGCVIVKNNTPIAIGYNGTPSGEDNCCEEEDGYFLINSNGEKQWVTTQLKTKSTVIHAEDNALRKLTKSQESAEGSSVFVTTAPCLLCATRLVDAGVKEVYYTEIYNNDEGINYLKKHNIYVEQITIE